MSLHELETYVQRTFSHVAESRGVQFHTVFAKDLPARVFTDPRRLQQVLKNLLSNAFKFTEHGSVKLIVKPAVTGWGRGHPTLDQAKGGVLEFIVQDTGIGIPIEKQQVIFEAFQQAEGSTSRKYGGTGLGLAISRELSRMLGGEMTLQSEVGVGSTFTLFLPGASPGSMQGVRTETPLQESSPLSLPTLDDTTSVGEWAPQFVPNDDRQEITAQDMALLIVDNDRGFLDFVIEVARSHGFKALGTTNGGEAVWLARNFLPAGILLDIKLEDIDGWRVLDYLKSNPQTRHIPITVVSTDDQTTRGLQNGARRVMVKPILRASLDALFDRLKMQRATEKRRLLLVEDDAVQRTEIVRKLTGEDLEIVVAGTAAEALAAATQRSFDVIVMDLGLPDMSGTELLQRFEQLPNWDQTPVILHTARDVATADQAFLQNHSRDIVLKTADGKALQDAVSMWLHRRLAVSEPADDTEAFTEILRGRRVLLVDDDIRNIFALTSLLERYEVDVGRAENGRNAIGLVRSNSWDLVLMDIMMPEMDGYDTIRAIRGLGQHHNLPIIALTAKAMHGDRQKCFDAGASDYIPKPIDSTLLLSRMSAWLTENPLRRIKATH
jgi:CheY-like chemotaxis protein